MVNLLILIEITLAQNYVSYYQEGYKSYKNGDLNKAEEFLQKAINLYPDYLPSLKLMAEIYVRQNKYKEAIIYYKRALLVNPKDTEARINLADVYGWKGEYDRSIGLYKEVLEDEPNNVSAMLGLAKVLRWAQRFEEAKNIYRQIIQKEPENINALSGLSTTLAFTNNYEKAIDIINKAIEISPQDAELYKNKAEFLSWQGRFKEAIAIYNEALKLNPKDPEIYHNIGNTFTWSKNYKRAVEAFEKAYNLEPENINHLLDMAKAYLLWNKLSQAEKILQKVIRKDPQNGEAQNLLHQIKFRPKRDLSELIERYIEPILLIMIMLSILVYYRIKEDILKYKNKFFWIISHRLMPILITLSIIGFTFSSWTDLLNPFSSTISDIMELLLIFVLGVSFFLLILFPNKDKTSYNNYLILGAHPDDVELGCAGTIAKLKNQGARIIVLIFSGGEKSGDRNIRQAEAKEAANYLNYDILRLFNFPDTQFSAYIPHIVNEIEQLLKKYKISTIITHSPYDIHQDHRAIFEAAKIAAREQVSLLCYEDVSTDKEFIPNYFVDITEFIDIKLKAIKLFKTQKDKIYMSPEAIKGRAAHRGLQAGVKYAEAFLSYKIIS